MDIEKYRPFFTYHPIDISLSFDNTHMCYMSCGAIIRYNMFGKTLRALPGQFSRQNDQNPTSGTKCAKSVCDPDKTFYTLSRARFVGHDSGVLDSRALA